MKPSAYIIVILILAAALTCLVSAEEMNYQKNLGYQIQPNMTTGSSGDGISRSQNQGPGQQGQQGLEQTKGQSTPAYVSTGVPGSQPGTTPISETSPQKTRQTDLSQTEQPVSQSPQKTPTQAENLDINHKEPVQTSQPTPKAQEQKQAPVQPVTQQPGSQYHTISIPQSYPEFRQDHAAIQVTSNPGGAGVYLDGTYKGITPSSGYLEISDLSPGTYTIHLTLSGYTDYTTEIKLSRNEVSTISADLTSTHVSSEYGALSVQSTPSGADVYLDNEYKGITPVSLQGIGTGSHSVLIKTDGYSSYSGDVSVIPDQASGLSVTLTAITTQTQTQAPAPTLPPVPVPTKSPISPLIPVAGIAAAGIILNRQRKQ
ncbi:MAG TPA: PEGA domain-containing protein [Methanospirillum sp.]|nr:PEGA domain-containing protein [Methanospirillum sp.]